MLPIEKGKFSERTKAERGACNKGIGETGGGRSGRLGRAAVCKCGKAGTGLQWGETVLGKGPVTEEMMQRRMGQKVH